MAGCRQSGREANQLRPMRAEIACQARADGSARFSLGETTVAAAVFGFRDVPVRKELSDRTSFEMTWRGEGGNPNVEDAFFERLLLEVLGSMVAVHERPRSLCAISVQVLVDDGSTLACALCAMAMALLDAGIPLNGTFSAVQAGFYQAEWILDPTAAEEKACAALVTAAFVQRQGESERQLLFCNHRGALELEQLDYALQAVSNGALATATFVRQSLEKRFSKELGVKAKASAQAAAKGHTASK